MTQTDGVRREQVRRVGAQPEQPWNVILHNDHTPINRVVWRLYRSIPGMTLSKSSKIT